VSLSVDTTPLTAAAASSPELAMGALVGLLGVVVSIAGATGKHKAWSLLALSPPLVAWVLVQVHLRPTRWFGFDSPCVTLLNQQAHELITWSFALSALAVAQLIITLVLTASGKHRFGWATCVLLAMALATGAMVGVHRRAAVLSFHASVMEAQPVPHVIPPNLPPRAHVGLRRFVEPQLLHAGARTGFIFTSTVALDPRAARAWGVERLELTALSVGLTELKFHRSRGPLSFDFTYPVEGVADEGPSWLPLAAGNRFEFVATNPLGLDATKRKYSARKAVMPVPTVTLQVASSFERDGLRIFRVVLSRGSDSKTVELTRQNGELFDSTGARLAGQDDCRIPFLWARSQCTCAEDHVQWCVEIEQDGLGFFLRFALGVMTLGVTELTGAMRGVGEAHERRGLVTTRWILDGVEHTLNQP
jgi:hypothetical protein